jgi:hypothetical protein
LKQEKNGDWTYSARDVVNYLLSEYHALNQEKIENHRIAKSLTQFSLAKELL